MTVSHAAGVHRDELFVKAGKSPLILGDQQGIEGRQPIARDLKGDPPGLGQNPLLAVPIAAVDPAVRFAGLQVMIDLGVQNPLGQRLLQLIQQAILLKCRLRVRPGQQLIQQLIGNNRWFPSCHTMPPQFPSLWPLHEIPDTPETVRQALKKTN